MKNMSSTLETKRALESTKHTINPSTAQKSTAHKSSGLKSSSGIKTSGFKSSTMSGKSTRSDITTTSAGGILKTVILPYDEINNLKAECEYLKNYKQQ